MEHGLVVRHIVAEMPKVNCIVLHLVMSCKCIPDISSQIKVIHRIAKNTYQHNGGWGWKSLVVAPLSVHERLISSTFIDKLTSTVHCTNNNMLRLNQLCKGPRITY